MNRCFGLALLLTVHFGAAEGPSRRDRYGDPLPEGAVVRLGTRRMRTPAPSHLLALSPDGKALLTGGFEGRIVTWDTATGKKVREWALGKRRYASLTYRPDGRTVLASDADGFVRLLDAITGKEAWSFHDTVQKTAYDAVALSPDGTTLVAVCNERRQLVVADAATKAVTHRVDNVLANSFRAPEFTPDGKYFVALWTDHRPHLIDVATGKSVRCLAGAVRANSDPKRQIVGSTIWGFTLSRDGKRLFWRGTCDRDTHEIDVATGRKLRGIDLSVGNDPCVGNLVLSPDGRVLLDWANESIGVWDVAAGKLLRQLKAPLDELAGSLRMTVSANGKTVAAARETSLFIWGVETGRLLQGGTGQTSPVRLLQFSPDGRHVASMDRQTICLWDASDGRELHRVANGTRDYGLEQLRFLPGGKTLSWVNDRNLDHWMPGANPTRENAPMGVPAMARESVTPDGRLLAGIRVADRKLCLVDLVGKEADRLLEPQPVEALCSLDLSRDGRLVARGDALRFVTLYDTATSKVCGRIPVDLTIPETGTPPRVSFDPAGRILLVHYGQPILYETCTVTERLRLPPRPKDWYTALAWCPTGRLMATGHRDGSISVYDTWTGTKLLERKTEQGEITSLAFRRDLRRLASAGANTTVLVWEVPKEPALARVAGMTEAKAWDDLGSSDAKDAFRAVTHLVALGDDAVRLLRRRLILPPDQPIDPRHVNRLIRDLDGNDYALRERATRELSAIGAAAEPALLRMVGSQSLELSRRAERLVQGIQRDRETHRTRLHRVVEVLEQLATPAARRAMRELNDANRDPDVKAMLRANFIRLGEANHAAGGPGLR